jgi:hypothetical protein
LLSEFAGPSPIEFDLALKLRRVFSSALRCSAPQRLELVGALLELLKFGDGGTNAEGRPHGDLTRIGRGAGLAASIGQILAFSGFLIFMSKWSHRIRSTSGAPIDRKGLHWEAP